jgi:hypothetical protein
MSKSEPYRCVRCLEEGSYNGFLRFPGDPPPVCKNHGKDEEQWLEMEPVEEKE